MIIYVTQEVLLLRTAMAAPLHEQWSLYKTMNFRDVLDVEEVVKALEDFSDSQLVCRNEYEPTLLHLVLSSKCSMIHGLEMRDRIVKLLMDGRMSVLKAETCTFSVHMLPEQQGSTVHALLRGRPCARSLRRLLAAGADPNRYDVMRQTPLNVVVRLWEKDPRLSEELCRTLMYYDANPVKSDGKPFVSALDLAVGIGATPLLAYFASAVLPSWKLHQRAVRNGDVSLLRVSAFAGRRPVTTLDLYDEFLALVFDPGPIRSHAFRTAAFELAGLRQNVQAMAKCDKLPSFTKKMADGLFPMVLMAYSRNLDGIRLHLRSGAFVPERFPNGLHVLTQYCNLVPRNDRTVALLRRCFSRRWTRGNHCLHPIQFRRATTALLRTACRLGSSAAGVPFLPPEIWLHIVSLMPRTCG